jgi:hypothetical protein
MLRSNPWSSATGLPAASCGSRASNGNAATTRSPAVLATPLLTALAMPARVAGYGVQHGCGDGRRHQGDPDPDEEDDRQHVGRVGGMCVYPGCEQ